MHRAEKCWLSRSTSNLEATLTLTTVKIYCAIIKSCKSELKTPEVILIRSLCTTSFYMLIFIRYVKLLLFHNTGQSVPIPRHSQTRAKKAGLVTLET